MAVILFCCHKKDRLSSSTFNFTVTPASSQVLKTDSVTLVAQGDSPNGTVDVSPTWTVSPESRGTLNTSVGKTVVFQPAELGDVVISATYDGVVATSQIAIVTYVPSGNTFDVYNDAGLPSGSGINSEIFTSRSFLAEQSSGYTPEGLKYQRASETSTNDFWGVTVDKANVGLRKNLSAFSSGSLKFALRLNRVMDIGESLQIDLTGPGAAVSKTLVSGSDGFNRLNTDWQEISLSIPTYFPGLDTSQMKNLFAIKTTGANTPLTYDVDAIRWEK